MISGVQWHRDGVAKKRVVSVITTTPTIATATATGTIAGGHRKSAIAQLGVFANLETVIG
jgi:hypothetical protein